MIHCYEFPEGRVTFAPSFYIPPDAWRYPKVMRRIERDALAQLGESGAREMGMLETYVAAFTRIPKVTRQ